MKGLTLNIELMSAFLLLVLATSISAFDETKHLNHGEVANKPTNTEPRYDLYGGPMPSRGAYQLINVNYPPPYGRPSTSFTPVNSSLVSLEPSATPSPTNLTASSVSASDTISSISSTTLPVTSALGMNSSAPTSNNTTISPASLSQITSTVTTIASLPGEASGAGAGPVAQTIPPETMTITTVSAGITIIRTRTRPGTTLYSSSVGAVTASIMASSLVTISSIVSPASTETTLYGGATSNLTATPQSAPFPAGNSTSLGSTNDGSGTSTVPGATPTSGPTSVVSTSFSNITVTPWIPTSGISVTSQETIWNDTSLTSIPATGSLTSTTTARKTTSNSGNMSAPFTNTTVSMQATGDTTIPITATESTLVPTLSASSANGTISILTSSRSGGQDTTIDLPTESASSAVNISSFPASSLPLTISVSSPTASSSNTSSLPQPSGTANGLTSTWKSTQSWSTVTSVPLTESVNGPATPSMALNTSSPTLQDTIISGTFIATRTAPFPIVNSTLTSAEFTSSSVDTSPASVSATVSSSSPLVTSSSLTLSPLSSLIGSEVSSNSIVASPSPPISSSNSTTVLQSTAGASESQTSGTENSGNLPGASMTGVKPSVTNSLALSPTNSHVASTTGFNNTTTTSSSIGLATGSTLAPFSPLPIANSSVLSSSLSISLISSGSHSWSTEFSTSATISVKATSNATLGSVTGASWTVRASDVSSLFTTSTNPGTTLSVITASGLLTSNVPRPLLNSTVATNGPTSELISSAIPMTTQAGISVLPTAFPTGGGTQGPGNGTSSGSTVSLETGGISSSSAPLLTPWASTSLPTNPTLPSISSRPSEKGSASTSTEMTITRTWPSSNRSISITPEVISPTLPLFPSGNATSNISATGDVNSGTTSASVSTTPTLIDTSSAPSNATAPSAVTETNSILTLSSPEVSQGIEPSSASDSTTTLNSAALPDTSFVRTSVNGTITISPVGSSVSTVSARQSASANLTTTFLTSAASPGLEPSSPDIQSTIYGNGSITITATASSIFGTSQQSSNVGSSTSSSSLSIINRTSSAVSAAESSPQITSQASHNLTITTVEGTTSDALTEQPAPSNSITGESPKSPNGQSSDTYSKPSPTSLRNISGSQSAPLVPGIPTTASNKSQIGTLVSQSKTGDITPTNAPSDHSLSSSLTTLSYSEPSSCIDHACTPTLGSSVPVSNSTSSVETRLTVSSVQSTSIYLTSELLGNSTAISWSTMPGSRSMVTPGGQPIVTGSAETTSSISAFPETTISMSRTTLANTSAPSISSISLPEPSLTRGSTSLNLSSIASETSTAASSTALNSTLFQGSTLSLSTISSEFETTSPPASSVTRSGIPLPSVTSFQLSSTESRFVSSTCTEETTSWTETSTCTESETTTDTTCLETSANLTYSTNPVNTMVGSSFLTTFSTSTMTTDFTPFFNSTSSNLQSSSETRNFPTTSPLLPRPMVNPDHHHPAGPAAHSGTRSRSGINEEDFRSGKESFRDYLEYLIMSWRGEKGDKISDETT